MRLERVCVRRLKSFMDYSNAAVELCALLDENDKVDDVVEMLAFKAEAYVRRIREIDRLEELKSALEDSLADLRRLQGELQEKLNTALELRSKLEEAVREIEKLEADARQAAGILEKIKEKLRG